MNLDLNIHDENARTANIKNNSRKSPIKSPALKTISGGFWLLFVDRHRAVSYRW